MKSKISVMSCPELISRLNPSAFPKYVIIGIDDSGEDKLALIHTAGCQSIWDAPVRRLIKNNEVLSNVSRQDLMLLISECGKELAA